MRVEKVLSCMQAFGDAHQRLESKVTEERPGHDRSEFLLEL
jgi:hypothetical protein